MKACTICNQELPPTSFSTLIHRRGSVTANSTLEGVACTPCYLMQIVTHYPRLSVDDSGRCVVAYVPYDKPRWEYVAEIEKKLTAWKRDAKPIEPYSRLGSIDEQIRPFREWVDSNR